MRAFSSSSSRQGHVRFHRRPFTTQLQSGNLLEPVTHLEQDYFALRHGQSLANVAGIIMSDPTKACNNYGLSEVGKEQAIAAAGDVRQAFLQNEYERLVILSSDLLRAKETALLVANHCGGLPFHKDEVIIETRLRERWFGEWDGSSDENYNKVWQDDAEDSTHTIKGVESVHAVIERTTRCILEWDKALSQIYGNRCMVILVAHGDVLQILQTAFEKKDGKLHRSLQHLETAQLRQLKLGF